MPTYGYVCVKCGDYDVTRPMAATTAPAPCPSCARPGRRVFAAPAVRRVDPGLRRAMDAGARSADAPAVVASPPPRTGRVQRRVTDPRQARLPRP